MLISSALRFVDLFSDRLNTTLIQIKNNERALSEPWGCPVLMVQLDENLEFMYVLDTSFPKLF